VSLILEALRKLERDKDAPERGFVVMTHVPWAQGGKRSRLVAVSAFALALAVGALAIALWRGRGVKPAAPEPRATAAAAVPTPAPVASPPESPAKAPTPAPFDARALALESKSRLTAAPEGTAASATPVASTPPRPSAQPRSDLRLNAISQQGGKPVAILNDRLVHEGDVFEGIRVIRIGETKVEVEVKGERRILRF
jgi:hypothetical protein